MGVVGLGTSIYGEIKAGQQERKLENAKSPTFMSSPGIADYYAKALSRYNINPYETPLYQQQLQSAQQATATGLNAAQDRRGGLAAIPGLIYGQNQASLGAAATAQEQQAQALAQLGGAASAQAGQQMQSFDINQMQPFVRNYNLLAMKASGANQLANAGIQTAVSGATSYAQQEAMKQYLGQQQLTTNVTPQQKSLGSPYSTSNPSPLPISFNSGSPVRLTPQQALYASMANPSLSTLQNPASYSYPLPTFNPIS